MEIGDLRRRLGREGPGVARLRREEGILAARCKRGDGRIVEQEYGIRQTRRSYQNDVAQRRTQDICVVKE